MKKKLKTLGIIALSLIGVLALFIGIIGIGNYFQDIGFNSLGTSVFFLFPITLYFAVRIFNWKINGLKSKQYGFGFKNIFSSSLLGIILAIGIVSIVLLIAYLFFDIHIKFIALQSNITKPLLNLVSTMLIVGVWEEFYFRGLVYNTLLKQGFGFYLSIFISSILFSIIHWSSFDMTITSWWWYLGIVFMGYVFVLIYNYTNSIWSAVFFHSTWDILATLMDGSENKIGLFEITDFSEHSKTIDNIEVVLLGILVGISLYFYRKQNLRSRIKNYTNTIITAIKKDTTFSEGLG